MTFLRAGICALVVFAVVAHGGVEDWARAVLEIGAGLLFLVWSLWFYFNREEQLVFSPLLPPLAALSIIVLGQLLFRWTASPYNTRMELLLLLADLIVLFSGASLSDSGGLAGFRVVRNDFRFPGQPLRHPPTPDIERQALLVS